MNLVPIGKEVEGPKTYIFKHNRITSCVVCPLHKINYVGYFSEPYNICKIDGHHIQDVNVISELCTLKVDVE